MDLSSVKTKPTVTGVISPIGRLLLEANKLTPDDVQHVIARQKRDGSRFGEAAIALGLVASDDVFRALAIQFEYPQRAADAAFDKKLVIAWQPLSARAEALRSLRSQLQLCWFGGSRKFLAICGTRSGDGCSEVAANLALAFAQIGERTLLIDADMRNPKLHDFFGLDGDFGLSNLLAGRGVFADATRRCPGFDDLSILCAGTPPPNPQELLSRPTFVNLLNDAAAKYDVVLIDTPPAAGSADAQFAAAIAGGGLHVLRRHHARAADLRYVKEQFQSVGIMNVGAVLLD